MTATVWLKKSRQAQDQRDFGLAEDCEHERENPRLALTREGFAGAAEKVKGLLGGVSAT